MDNTLTTFIQYFRDLAAAHVELQGSFVHGAAGRIIAGSRSGLKYPALWLETPTLSLSDKDGTTSPYGERRAAFVVLMKVPADDYDEQDAGWERAEVIALDVLAMMREDRKKRRIAFSLDGSQLEAVATITVDNEIGWRYEFALGDFVPLKFNPARWVAPTV